MGHHLTEDGTFKSDKYDWCPEGFFALKFTDANARIAIRRYADLVRVDDPKLSDDLMRATLTAQHADLWGAS